MKKGWFNERHRHFLAAKGIKTSKYLARTPIGSTVENIFSIQDRQRKKIKSQGEIPDTLRLIRLKQSLQKPLTEKEKEAVQIIMNQLSSSTTSNNNSSNLRFFSEYDPKYADKEEERIDLIIKKFTTRIENNNLKVSQAVRTNEDAGKTDEANIKFEEELKDIEADNKIANKVVENYKKEKELLKKINSKYVNGVDLTIKDRMFLGGLVKKARGVNE